VDRDSVNCVEKDKCLYLGSFMGWFGLDLLIDGGGISYDLLHIWTYQLLLMKKM